MKQYGYVMKYGMSYYYPKKGVVCGIDFSVTSFDLSTITLFWGVSMRYSYLIMGLRYELRLPCNRVSVQRHSRYVYSPLWRGNMYDTDYLYGILSILLTSIV